MFPEYKRSTVYAVIGGALHCSLVSLVLFLEFMGLGGENPLSWLVGFGIRLYITDFHHILHTLGDTAKDGVFVI